MEAEAAFDKYCRWVTFWSAALALAALVALYPVLLRGDLSGVYYAVAIGFAASILKFRVSVIDIRELSDMSAPGAVRKSLGGVFLRYALIFGALVAAGLASGFSPPAIIAAGAALFLTNAVVIAEVLWGLSGG